MSKELGKDVIKSILNDLSKERPVFCSEADFQLELCRYIRNYFEKNNIKDFKILPEYYYNPNNEKPMYIDILIIVNSKWYPIELKYKTRGNSDHNILLKYETDGCEFTLMNHGAYDNNCYKYLYDILRIEKIKKENENFEEGYAIMLSNDAKYWEGPEKENCIYSDFIIKNGRTILPKKEGLKWDEKASKKTIDGCEMPLKFDDEYKMEWETYGIELNEKQFTNIKIRDIKNVSQFKYIICTIKTKNLG